MKKSLNSKKVRSKKKSKIRKSSRSKKKSRRVCRSKKKARKDGVKLSKILVPSLFALSSSTSVPLDNCEIPSVLPSYLGVNTESQIINYFIENNNLDCLTDVINTYDYKILNPSPINFAVENNNYNAIQIIFDNKNFIPKDEINNILRNSLETNNYKLFKYVVYYLDKISSYDLKSVYLDLIEIIQNVIKNRKYYFLEILQSYIDPEQIVVNEKKESTNISLRDIIQSYYELVKNRADLKEIENQLEILNILLKIKNTISITIGKKIYMYNIEDIVELLRFGIQLIEEKSDINHEILAETLLRTLETGKLYYKNMGLIFSGEKSDSIIITKYFDFIESYLNDPYFFNLIIAGSSFFTGIMGIYLYKYLNKENRQKLYNEIIRHIETFIPDFQLAINENENDILCNNKTRCDFYFDNIDLEEKNNIVVENNIKGIIKEDGKVICIDLEFEKKYFDSQNDDVLKFSQSQLNGIKIYGCNALILPYYKFFKLIRYEDEDNRITHILVPCKRTTINV